MAEEKNAAEAKRGGLKGGASAEVENKTLNGEHAPPADPRDETRETQTHAVDHSGGASLRDALKCLIYGVCYVS